VLKNKEPANRKPFTDKQGKELKACQVVEVLNGAAPGYVILAKVIWPGARESFIEYEKNPKENRLGLLFCI
jgi:hypothetical protein